MSRQTDLLELELRERSAAFVEMRDDRNDLANRVYDLEQQNSDLRSLVNFLLERLVEQVPNQRLHDVSPAQLRLLMEGAAA